MYGRFSQLLHIKSQSTLTYRIGKVCSHVVALHFKIEATCDWDIINPLAHLNHVSGINHLKPLLVQWHALMHA